MTIDDFHREHVFTTPADALDEALRRLTAAEDIEQLRAVESPGWIPWPDGGSTPEA